MSDRPTTTSLFAMIAVVVMVAGLITADHLSGSRTAAALNAGTGVSVLPTEETTFDRPQAIQWSGTISRSFVGGEGIEIVSSASEGGVFQAYMPMGQISPVTSGAVVVQGLWIGYTCAYGGHNGGCVPEVSIENILQ